MRNAEAFADIIAALRCGRPGCECRSASPEKRTVSLHCPAHEDTKPSLSLTLQGEKLLWCCQRGCSQDAVLRVLQDRGLLPARRTTPRVPVSRPAPIAPDQNGDSHSPPTTRRVAATYAYTDEEGRVLFEVVRTDPKGFFQRRPDGSGGWVNALDGARLVPYRLPELLAAVARGDHVFIVEGEKDVETLRAFGLVGTTNPMGAGKWRPEFAGFFRGSRSVVLPDNDDAGDKHAQDVVRSLLPVAGEVRVVRLPGLPPKGDVSDWVAAGHTRDELLRLVGEAAPSREETLADLLDRAEEFLRRYVAFANPHQASACVLWAAHTWVYDAFDVSPFLHVTSPEKRSGKTRLLEVLELLVRAPWRVITPSEAVLFRKVDSAHPTLLLDEADAIFGRRRDDAYEPLRALLNAGNRRGVRVPRCVGEGRNVQLLEFDVFSPRVIAGIGRLPDTVEDRAVPVQLRRRAPGEMIAAFRRRQATVEAESIHQALGRWAAVALPTLRDARPEVPISLHDRAAELWEVFLAIADMAGGAWPTRAREAAVTLHGDNPDDDTLGVSFLRAVRAVFEDWQTDEISTSDLLEALTDREDTPAAEWWAKSLKDGNTSGPARKLAGILRAFGIEPTKWRSDEETIRGYRRADFKDSWERYLPSPPPSPEGGSVRHSATALDTQGPEVCREDPVWREADATRTATGSAPPAPCVVKLSATDGYPPQREPLSDKACGGVADAPPIWGSEERIEDSLIAEAVRRFGNPVVEVRRAPWKDGTLPGMEEPDRP